MKYFVDRNAAESGYLQLYRQLRKDIVGGILKTGSRLPSKRLLADEIGMSVVTVEHAYAILCDEGYAEARERSGYYVSFRAADCFPVSESAAPVAAAHPHTYDGAFPYGVLARTMRRVMSDYGEALLVKSPNDGCSELRQAVADYLARSRGIRVPSTQVIVGSGAEYLYGLIVQMLGRNRIFAVEDPSYEKIRRVYDANGVICERLRLGADGVRTDELARTRASVLHVTPFHSFPSGITASASKRSEYLRWASQRGGYLVEDDFDSEFTLSTKSEDTLFSLQPDGPVIYLNTFSKTIAPSIRVGYMVLPPNLLEQYHRKVGFYSCPVPVFEQYLLSELLRSGEFERHINRVRRSRRRQQR